MSVSGTARPAPGQASGRRYRCRVARFDNSFLRELPELAERWKADDHPAPATVLVNRLHAEELGFDPDWLNGSDGAAFVTGDRVIDGSEPVAQAYTGHQFGNLVPRLGDGRALLIGEVLDDGGRRHDVHLKGSGRTSFARGGDGKAVLGPMLREYLMCEAMHALGVPTTRALAVASTGERVARDSLQPGAVFARTAASHLRVGTFQYAEMQGDAELLERLLRHAVRRHHGEAVDAEASDVAVVATGFLDAVMEAQARLVAKWMSIGFVHGVLNTDNVTVSGETIDYGPCAFMDAYDPATCFSSIDHGGRYAYGNQPGITQWNLARLAEALLPLIAADTDEAIEIVTRQLRTFSGRYDVHWRAQMAAKLAVDSENAALPGLVDDLLALLAADDVDWTESFRAMTTAASGDTTALRNLFVDLASIDAWVARWTPHLDRSMVSRLDAVNPLYTPRNHLVEEALTAATEGDLDPFIALLRVLSTPFTRQSVDDRYEHPAPADAGRYRTFCGT